MDLTQLFYQKKKILEYLLFCMDPFKRNAKEISIIAATLFLICIAAFVHSALQTCIKVESLSNTIIKEREEQQLQDWELSRCSFSKWSILQCNQCLPLLLSC